MIGMHSVDYFFMQLWTTRHSQWFMIY